MEEHFVSCPGNVLACLQSLLLRSSHQKHRLSHKEQVPAPLSLGYQQRVCVAAACLLCLCGLWTAHGFYAFSGCDGVPGIWDTVFPWVKFCCNIATFSIVKSISVFIEWLSCVIATESLLSIKPKIFTTWNFYRKRLLTLVLNNNMKWKVQWVFKFLKIQWKTHWHSSPSEHSLVLNTPHWSCCSRALYYYVWRGWRNLLGYI